MLLSLLDTPSKRILSARLFVQLTSRSVSLHSDVLLFFFSNKLNSTVKSKKIVKTSVVNIVFHETEIFLNYSKPDGMLCNECVPTSIV